jgi:hypothetical protein
MKNEAAVATQGDALAPNDKSPSRASVNGKRRRRAAEGSGSFLSPSKNHHDKSPLKKKKLFITTQQHEESATKRQALGFLPSNNGQAVGTRSDTPNKASRRKSTPSKKMMSPGFTIFSPTKQSHSVDANGTSILEANIMTSQPQTLIDSVSLSNDNPSLSSNKSLIPRTDQESLENDKSEEKICAESTFVEKDVPQDSSSIQYPTVPIPSPEDVHKQFAQAVAEKSSHQYQLTRLANLKVLSFEDVILPVLAREEMEALKDCERNAMQDASLRYRQMLKEIRQLQKKGNSELEIDQHALVSKKEFIEQDAKVQLFQSCRAVIKKCRNDARKSAQAERLLMEEEREEALRQAAQKKAMVEAAKHRKEQEAQRMQRRNEKKIEKEKRRHKRRLEYKKQYPKNKELWREVALLMTAQAKLEREAREWDAAIANLEAKEKELKEIQADPEKMKEWRAQKLQSLGLDGERHTETRNPAKETKKTMDETVHHIVEDIQLSTDRINQTLTSILSDVKESDVARKELFDKYTTDHQFRGYKGVNHTKALIQNMINSGINSKP